MSDNAADWLVFFLFFGFVGMINPRLSFATMFFVALFAIAGIVDKL